MNGDFADEERMIERGRNNGSISAREAQRLYSQLWEARALEREALYDGLLTSDEEADLYWAERDLNRDVRKESRDYDRW